MSWGYFRAVAISVKCLDPVILLSQVEYPKVPLKVVPQFLFGSRGVNDSPWHLWRTASSFSKVCPQICLIKIVRGHFVRELLTRHSMSATAPQWTREPPTLEWQDKFYRRYWKSFLVSELCIFNLQPLGYKIFNTFRSLVREKLLYYKLRHKNRRQSMRREGGSEGLRSSNPSKQHCHCYKWQQKYFSLTALY